MAQKLTYFLLITLVLSLGFGQLLRFETNLGPIFLHDLSVLAIIGLNFRHLRIPEKPYRLPLQLFLSGLLLGFVRALTLYQPGDLLVPSLYALRLLAYLAFFLLLQTTRIKMNLTYFVTSALVCIAIGLLQYRLLPDMRLFAYLGWDDHLHRLTMPHYDPTFTGAMLSIFVLLTPPKYWSASLLGLIAILLTYSRSIWLSLAATAGLFIKNKAVLVVGLSVLMLAVLALPQKFGEGNNLLRTYSLSSRITTDLDLASRYKLDLLLGRGMNTLVLDESPGEYPSRAHGPNNSYLYLLVTTGILGLTGWLLFLHALYLRSAYQPLIVFIAIASIANNVMFYPFTLLLLLLSPSIAPTSALRASPSRSPRGRQPAPAPLARPRRAGKKR